MSGQPIKRDRPWHLYPNGTKAPALGGGHWIRVTGGWSWHHGNVFPAHGDDNLDQVILPEEPVFTPAPPSSGKPVVTPAPQATGKPVVTLANEELTLRDVFACAALQGMLADPTTNGCRGDDFAGAAYFYADAMLEARKGGTNE